MLNYIAEVDYCTGTSRVNIDVYHADDIGGRAVDRLEADPRETIRHEYHYGDVVEVVSMSPLSAAIEALERAGWTIAPTPSYSRPLDTLWRVQVEK